MKKLILITGLFLLTLSGFSQAWTVTVTLDGDCVYPQSETVYVVHVMIHENFQLVAQNTVITSNTNWGSETISVVLPQFCTGDDGDYQILIEGGKVDVNTKEELCRGKDTIAGTFTCAEFSGGSISPLTLNVE